MKKTVLFVLLIFSVSFVFAQNSRGRTFWKETFDEGNIPSGWKNVALNDSNVVWMVTDQPFPGSAGREYQAPPIASASRGYHLQFAPGVKVNKNLKRWKKAGLVPEAYIETPPIDCSKHKSVVLTFQENFFWDEWQKNQSEKSGLIVAVSNDGKNWVQYDVHNKIPPTEDCPNPMNVELNITDVAAGQKNVYIRFWWQHMYRWYWMVDDIALSDAYPIDIQAEKIASKVEGNSFTKQDVISFDIVNLGDKPVTKDVDCFLKIDNRPVLKTSVKSSPSKPFGIIDTVRVDFTNIDLTDFGVHKIQFYTQMPGDCRTSNDTIYTELYSQACRLGKVTDIQKTDKEVIFACNLAKVSVQFVSEDVFRIQMAYDGKFTNPAGNDLIIATPDNAIQLSTEDRGDYFLMKTPQLALRAYKGDLRFALYKQDNQTLVWEEVQGITYGKQTVQYLRRGPDEQFFGGGMQNGRFSHRGKTIKMTIDYNWEDGGNPNPSTFYMSNAGYGAVRNTYATGAYTFGDTVKLVHDESRFDCYYMVESSLKSILNRYTDLTGKPFFVPRWGLGMGDSNCYNRGAKSGKTIGTTATGVNGLTPSVINLIADEYIKHDMPRGWILPNDGYGCGYTDLKYVVGELSKRGFHTGLWTENGVEKIAKEVGEYGTRLCKLDVAWVGPGFKFAIDGATAAFSGIEKNSNGRGYIWMMCGWTGSQRNAVLWTGDQSGSYNYIRWHIPTVIGSGLSGQNYATGDVDGIFGGSDSTYVRDLQWKCFTPVFMSMSGWAHNNKNGIVDKQPWLFGEPFTSINRKYLMLKQRLTPYMYTLCEEAHRTGVPAVRGLVLEYPQDPVTSTDAVKYQFLLGKDLLVAPVYKPEAERDSIYLPEGKWFDYWNGDEYNGKTTLRHYSAPLDKLPLFVRAGAIIPMYQQMMYDKQFPMDTLTLDIYPAGKSSYQLYEDDGDTQAYRKGQFATTTFEVDESNAGIVVSATSANGEYDGKEKQHTYLIDLHTIYQPRNIVLEGQKLKKVKTHSDFLKNSSCWLATELNGKKIIHVKTPSLPTNQGWKINIQ